VEDPSLPPDGTIGKVRRGRMDGKVSTIMFITPRARYSLSAYTHDHSLSFLVLGAYRWSLSNTFMGTSLERYWVTRIARGSAGIPPYRGLLHLADLGTFLKNFEEKVKKWYVMVLTQRCSY